MAMSYYVLLAGAFGLYRLAKVFYNLYLHPLAGFPGPKFGAATHLYEFYWSVVRDGEFIWEIERMHQKYGKAQADAIRCGIPLAMKSCLLHPLLIQV